MIRKDSNTLDKLTRRRTRHLKHHSKMTGSYLLQFAKFAPFVLGKVMAKSFLTEEICKNTVSISAETEIEQEMFCFMSRDGYHSDLLICYLEENLFLHAWANRSH
ncbi:hypothetical protein TNCT_364131 [Trichonephila clavata]|uniref:Uncharacterized protein n=1 Tax=Trichonephila clavata TaxID=2740835 RepID=A0A8X6I6T0_TRICU|nr:hypothetical protein TNCT_364131 [Trichonephila clavata]